MGRVYAARGADGTMAAIKVVSASSSEFMHAFEHERAILTKLEHANVSRILDGGRASGKPYIVMELVEGKPIDLYCRDTGASASAILKLFKQVLEGVAY